jgi:ABC-2 type transport system ATP-binding protein
VPVLSGVTFTVSEGEVVGLLGRNGAGKTTLMQMAMGLLFPHAGSVRVFGLSPTADPVAVKKRIGYVAEEQVLPTRSSIAELIALHRYLFPGWDDDLRRELLDRFHLSARARIGKLSKGEARQVALLCAVCHRPELLILDEPAGGLDPAARREFLETSIQLLNREGTTILFSSHYMNDVERLGGRVVLLDGGRVWLDRELDNLHESYCVALISRGSLADAAALERVPGCVRVRPVLSEWHAVFESTPEAAARQLRESLALDDVRCTRVPLEELFVELVGPHRTPEAPCSSN